MFDLPIIDVAITLSFTYFMISLMVSSLNEFIYSVISRRGNMLKKAIEDLFFDTGGEWTKYAQEKIFTNPRIQSLKRKATSFPSYVPASSFVAALMDSMRKGDQLLDMNAIRSELLDQSSVLPQQLRLSLLSMFEKAEGDLEKFQSEIESMYNHAMDRVSGWYKRETSYVIFGIAFIICIVANIDTINITKQLWGDPDKLIATTNQIANVAKNISYDTTARAFSKVDSNAFVGISANYEITTKDSANNSTKKITLNLDNGVQAGKTMASSGIPMGWDKTNGFQGKYWLPFKILGWLITALAVMLGAPFWFDLMNKFINLRGTGKKPEATNTQSSAGNSPKQPTVKVVG
jgi:hypothetical protein